MGIALKRGTSYKEEPQWLQTTNSYKLRDFIFPKTLTFYMKKKKKVLENKSQSRSKLWHLISFKAMEVTAPNLTFYKQMKKTSNLKK